MLVKGRDIPLAFAALTIALLIFAVVWTAPWPQLCPQQHRQGAYSNEKNSNAAVPTFGSRQNTTNSNPNECDEHAQSDGWAIRIGIATVVILFGQFLMFRWQLNAMRDGVRDAGDAARAAKSTAETAEKQVVLARDDFTATHRPWIALTNAGITAPMTWDGAGNAHVSLVFVVKNLGHSPALRVSVMPKIYPLIGPGNIREQQEVYKASVNSQNDPDPWGYALFPGQEMTQQVSVTIAAEDIAAMRSQAGFPMAFMLPTILGFIEYQFTFGEPKSHFTQFVYVIHRRQPEGGLLAIDTKAGDIPVGEMQLVTWISGWHAD